ncbi:hypothetical protein AX16_005522 [Volvariella volvacea WC 439]|nr:hypothetical protein AX16_005522 [Volvariella volvacea WC 439]
MATRRTTVTHDDESDERTRIFKEFLTSSSPIYNYKDDILRLLQSDQPRLIINIDDLRDYRRAHAEGLLKQPFDYLPALEEAFGSLIETLHDSEKREIASKSYHIGFSGSFGDHHVSPRTLQAAHLGKMISLEGIVTRCSLVRPKMLKSVHFCPETKQWVSRDYHDSTTSVSNVPPSTSVTPQTDDDGRLLQIEYGLSSFRDHQRISIQEMPERAPAGQLPRSVDIILDDDLVDRCKPGDRIQLVGVYRSVGGGSTGTFKSLILANNINLLSSKAGGGIAQTPLTDTDIRMINQLSKRAKIFDLLSQSIAPSIYGHDYIKRAILLLLLGGAEKNLPNGTHIRGDINLLMVGDPSTAKSQLLRFVLGTAPLAIATTGRGSSGVGLTAAVTTDKDTGERRLEAGAMVLADRGVVCIDEFDKMSDVDRVAIHEVMEQQTVTIAKAGIHTSLNARCSVIAAANPIYGQYDIHKDPHKNIALPDSLLSRFDLLFVVTDDVEEERDRSIADHVLRMHRYLPPGVEEGTPSHDNFTQSLAVDGPGVAQDEDATESSPFQKFDPLLHIGLSHANGRRTRSKTKRIELLTIPFIKKYIEFARSRNPPTLSKEAADHIVQVYANLRNSDAEGNQKRTSPLTARTLETLIRLSTAHAKARLATKVEKADAEEAERIMRFALFREVPRRQRRKKRDPKSGAGRRGPGGEGNDESSEDESGDEPDDNQSTPTPAPTGQNVAHDPIWGDDSQDVTMDDQAPPQASSSADDGTIQPERLELFRARVAHVFATHLQDQEQLFFDELVSFVNEDLPPATQFRRAEVMAGCNIMQEKEQLFMSDDIVYKL